MESGFYAWVLEGYRRGYEARKFNPFNPGATGSFRNLWTGAIVILDSELKFNCFCYFRCRYTLIRVSYFKRMNHYWVVGGR